MHFRGDAVGKSFTQKVVEYKTSNAGEYQWQLDVCFKDDQKMCATVETKPVTFNTVLPPRPPVRPAISKSNKVTFHR